MITEAQLGWMAAILDLKGMALVKNNQQRATRQLVMAVQSKDSVVINGLSRMTGTQPNPGSTRPPNKWMQRGCSDHCPEPHVHYEGGLPPITQWSITGAGALVVLYNTMPYMQRPDKWEAMAAETRENVKLTGQGSGMIRASVQRLADLGWQIPPFLLDSNAFPGQEKVKLATDDLRRLFM